MNGFLEYGRTYCGAHHREYSWYVHDGAGGLLAGGPSEAGETEAAARKDAAERGIRLVVYCTYCDTLVADDGREMTPDVDDDEAWAKLTPDHHLACDWVLTRAHRLEYPEDLAVTGATPLDQR